MATKPQPAGSLPNTWIGARVTVDVLGTPITGDLIAHAPLRHFVTVTLRHNGKDATITLASDDLIERA